MEEYNEYIQKYQTYIELYTQYEMDKVSDSTVTLADYTNGMDFSILGNIDNNTLNTPDF